MILAMLFKQQVCTLNTAKIANICAGTDDACASATAAQIVRTAAKVNSRLSRCNRFLDNNNINNNIKSSTIFWPFARVTYLLRAVVVHRTVRVGHVIVVLQRIVGAQQVLRLHFAAQTRNVSCAEIAAQLLHLLQFQQMYPQHLQGFDHLVRVG